MWWLLKFGGGGVLLAVAGALVYWYLNRDKAAGAVLYMFVAGFVSLWKERRRGNPARLSWSAAFLREVMAYYMGLANGEGVKFVRFHAKLQANLFKPLGVVRDREATERWSALWYGDSNDAAPATRDSRILLYVHGGAYVSGCAGQFAGTMQRLCRDMPDGQPLRVFSVEYPLAPEHPFPAPVDAVVRAYTWLVMEHCGGDASRVVVGGDSAGAGLTTALAFRLADGVPYTDPATGATRNVPFPAGLALLCPWVDLASTYADAERFAGSTEAVDYLQPAALARSAVQYVPDQTQWARNHLVSPLRASPDAFRGFPPGCPLFVAFATYELFAADVRRFLALWQRALPYSKPRVVEERANAVHDWCVLPDYFGAEATRAIAQWKEWIVHATDRDATAAAAAAAK